ncbi:hypothetical protein [Roseibacillus persicicus]|uniref:Uncharacterized protein n=1 Tax=Roseibacillus persicicus TaxID=454148 RepID=A0A918TEI1_9BACT|nr:hypothetical protein [Roseibacillus persicicus]GHC45291.1 hypothetical protein GCM10007100_08200 [Roseibacillus persicicus]
MSKPSYDGPVSIWCKGLFLDRDYFRRQLASGLEDETLEEALLAIQLSRYYPPSPANEANYETFCENLEALSAEFSNLEDYAKRARELLAQNHHPAASPQTLVDYCFTMQEKGPPLLKVYQNTPFQLLRNEQLSKKDEKKIYQRAIDTETCSNWFAMTRKLDSLFDDQEIREALAGITEPGIRKGLLLSLINRGLVADVLKIAAEANEPEQKTIFWGLARSTAQSGQKVCEKERRFWLMMLDRDPLHVFAGGAPRVTKDAAAFTFLLAPLKNYFYREISQHSEEFLLDKEPALSLNLLRMLLALEQGFNEDLWFKAARHRGYRIIEIDYKNGFKYGDRTAKNFPVSEFAVSLLKANNMEPPNDVPPSVPEPYRDPRDR